MEGAQRILGIIKWYNQEKGFGVVSSVIDGKEYFLHNSQCHSISDKSNLQEGVPVLFTHYLDESRGRETVKKIHLINRIVDVRRILVFWQNTNYSEDIQNDVISAISKYFLYASNGSGEQVKDAFEKLISFLLEISSRHSEFVRIFDTIKSSIDEAYETEKSKKIKEHVELQIIKRISPDNASSLLIMAFDSIYVSLYYCLVHSSICVNGITIILQTRSTYNVINELTRLITDINEEPEKTLLSEHKNIIFEEENWRQLNGHELIEAVHNGITSLPLPEEIYKKIRIKWYKEQSKVDYDEQFLIDNVSQFSSQELVSLTERYEVNDVVKEKLLTYKVRDIILNSDSNTWKYSTSRENQEISVLYTAITNNSDWITDNRSSIIKDDTDDSIVEKYNELVIKLYKDGRFRNINDDFVVFFIDKFSKDDIFSIVCREIPLQKKSNILLAKYINILRSKHHNLYPELHSFEHRASELLGEGFDAWKTSIHSILDEEERYNLWENNLNDIYPKDYIAKTLQSSKDSYEKLIKHYEDGRLSKEQVSELLLQNIDGINEIENRPTFYKAFYSITYLFKIDKDLLEKIREKKNVHYNLMLWYVTDTDELDFNALCNLFIYFEPEEQVSIIKRLFHMAEIGTFELTIEKLKSIVRVNPDLYHLISKFHPLVPIDVSTDIVINALAKLSETGNFSSEKEALNIIVNVAKYDKKKHINIGSYFDSCSGHKTFEWKGHRKCCGKIKKINNTFWSVNVNRRVTESVQRGKYIFQEGEVWNSSFQDIVNAIKEIPGRRWNAENSSWEVPLNNEDTLFQIAEEYGLRIDDSRANNRHMEIYEEKYEGNPAGVYFCEGRPAPEKHRQHNCNFMWCRNSSCFNKCVTPHEAKDWQNYTLLDFCRILNLDTDSYDSQGRYVKYGKYLSFSSIMNRANSILEHLYCRECGEMLEPVVAANYYANLVTRFHCTNESCSQLHKQIYISSCFNWKCNGVIDERDTKKCENDWCICPVCGSCCSTRIVQQRISNCKELGIPISPVLIDFVEHDRGHLEKREFFCYKCGNKMNRLEGEIYECPTCEVRYERRLYDFTPKYVSQDQLNI